MMLGVNSAITLVGFAACLVMFSILPVSGLAIALPVNFFAFAFFHDRMTNRQYFAFAIGTFATIFGILLLLILMFGRRPFGFLLG
jgi:hypothetical protein